MNRKHWPTYKLWLPMSGDVDSLVKFYPTLSNPNNTATIIALKYPQKRFILRPAFIYITDKLVGMFN